MLLGRGQLPVKEKTSETLDRGWGVTIYLEHMDFGLGMEVWGGGGVLYHQNGL